MPGRRDLLATAAGLLAARHAAAQTDPTRIIVNFTPGGSLDGTARILADHAMREGRGTVVVENRPGAGGNIGAAAVARARPDGRTLLAALDTALTVNPHLFRDMGFDPLRDLVPVAHLGSFQLVLLVHPGHPATDLRSFLEGARRSPAFYASGSVGSPGHLAMEHLRQSAGLPAAALEHVPQRGNPEALTAIVSGTVPAGFLAIGGGPDLVRSGRLRALAVSGAERAAVLPEVPTVAESGFPGFEVRVANLLLAPRGTPETVLAEWAAAAQGAMASDAARARLPGWGIDPWPGGDLPGLLAATHARWGRVVRDAGMRLE
ncbi:tripartite tricarboxylate transporter substrate binding protein [Roseomonas stagni]|uniref:Tripartite tricarboxylate transporter substrate binding protein n=1 Tax=Falsiroseomonas algicola TaxID=2716930 RepID=A0A6M1LSC9_9PROT|nr:tripartite tricarboxylate transporter substrate binding protein [Falsiroseomonas algicola]NGM23351.1 tripartite tricarboxylate transporter substrate binding protein [Falsiroseomonas algicola]